MPSSGTCRSCAKLLPAITDTSGYCPECLISTSRTVPTQVDTVRLPAEPRPGDPTATFIPSPATLPYSPPQIPQPVPSRAERLRAAGWLDVRRLTQGGMGELYVGFDPALQRQVVAKFVLADALTPAMRERFAVEATAMARFSHPNVTRLFAVGDAEGDDPYLVLEYVDGGNLADCLRRSSLPPAEAAELLEAVARGVAAANVNGLIHRDLKPSNILLDRSGPVVVPKVTDFGMAKDVDAVSPLTATSAVLGTPEYMSPEQAARTSGACDARSDVWGLAATLYAAVTGRAPFTRDLANPPVLTEPLTPPESLDPAVPPELSAVIRMGLEKHPNDRYQTANEFADDLKRFRAGEPVRARRRTWAVRAWRRARRVPAAVAAAGLVALLATGTLGAVLLRPEPPTVALPSPPRPNPTPDERIARKLDEFSSGKAITLLGESGPPDWQRSAFGAATPGETTPPEAAFTLSSIGEAWTLLVPEVTRDEYDIELELRDIESTAMAQPGQPVHWLGLLFGVTEIAGPAGSAVRCGFAVQFRDQDRRFQFGLPPVPERAEFQYQAHVVHPNQKPVGAAEMCSERPFLPKRLAALLGPWRPIRVEVRSRGITAYWWDDGGRRVPLAARTTFELNEIIGRLSNTVRQDYLPGGPPLPQWNPRRPFAILSARCTAGVRNVRLTPFSPPTQE